MNIFKSILVVLDRSDRDRRVCAKAAVLSRALDARLELFLCDAVLLTFNSAPGESSRSFPVS